MLLDHHMPTFHFCTTHHALVRAIPEKIYPIAERLDLSQSLLTKLLLTIREMPWHFKGNTSNNYKKLYNFGDLQKLGFLLLAKNPPHEFVLGIVGKFWGLTPKTVNLTPADFKGYQKKGMAKVGVNFSISQVSKNLYRIATETRIFCLDQTAKNKFRAYWTIVRPFSGLIRREWLRLIRTCAEVEK